MTRAGKRLWSAAAGLAVVALVVGALTFALPRTDRRASDAAPPPEPRIVALSPGIAVMLRDLGLADRIVGRHSFDRVLPRSLPSCGDQTGLDYEAILRLNPTHILLQQGVTDVPARLTELAVQHAWDVRVYALLELDDIDRCVRDLRARFMARPGDGESAELEQRWRDAMRFRGDHLASAGRVLLLGGVSPPAAFGTGSWHHQILERLGGRPAIMDGAPWITLDAEDVLRLSPDAIVLILPRAHDAAPGPAPTAAELKNMLGRVGTLGVPAVRSGRIALIDDPLAHTPSTAMIGLADELARILEDWSR